MGEEQGLFPVGIVSRETFGAMVLEQVIEAGLELESLGVPSFVSESLGVPEMSSELIIA